ncbi:MAG: hypothetical protein ACTHLU_14110 [Novosphingobium sp.]
MNPIAHLLSAGIVLAVLSAGCGPVHAKASAQEKVRLDTLKPGKVALDGRLGYILVRLGPKKSPSDKPLPVAFRRINEANGPSYLSSDAEVLRTSMVAVNPGRSFSDINDSGVYLVSAYPGRWVINNVGETCFSLGTYGFDVKQGEIVDIGTILTGLENGKSSASEILRTTLSPDLVNFGVLTNIVMSGTAFVKPAADAPVLPSQLQALPRRKADLSGDVRFANTCRNLINRVASLAPLAHQPPMSVQDASEAIKKINNPE